MTLSCFGNTICWSIFFRSVFPSLPPLPPSFLHCEDGSFHSNIIGYDWWAYVSVAWSQVSLQTIIHYTDNSRNRDTSLSCNWVISIFDTTTKMRSVHLRCGVKDSPGNNTTTWWRLVKYPRVCYMRSSPQRSRSRWTTEGGTSSTRLWTSDVLV